ncbi:MAG: serine/threonine-protein kinase, partial [Betaproteobacteria bacterium]
MNSEIALPRGYSLNEYRIESTLGIGGFGLTYLATDGNLNLKVAIKEYLPGELALRCEDQSVRSKSDNTLETFNWGRARFLEESRTLASFRHPNIVRVLRFFEANQTAYMVMEFVAGQALAEWVAPRRPPTEQALKALSVALLNGLEVIHAAGYLHRDIKPGNIFMRDDGSPVLLDFGSARVTSANTELTAIVSPGYAPLEQYHTNGHQGPWSDLYAFGAVLYWLVTGTKPVEATARVRNDPLKPAVQIGDGARYSNDFLKAIDWALAPAEEARPQAVDVFRDALQGIATPEDAQKTIFIAKPPVPAPAPLSAIQPSPTSVPAFDPETLKTLTAGLATHVGPIAAMVVRSSAKKAATLVELVGKVAAEIADDKTRAEFVKKHTPDDRSSPTGRPVHTVPSQSLPTQTAAGPSRFDPATLAKAETELAKYLGAVARVVVRRAAAKARDEAELYLLLADQIEDKEQKKLFVRKAMSVTGR